MKAISRRLRKLEEILTPQPNGPSIVDVLRNRRRRRIEKEGGVTFEETPLDHHVGCGCRTIAEVLRKHRRRSHPSGIATDNEEDSIGSAHVHRSSGTRHKAGVSTADRIH